MCGRARCTLNPQQVARACGFGDGDVRTLQTERFRPTYNASPGSYLPVAVLQSRKGLGEEEPPEGQVEAVVQCMKWGLVPSFTNKKEKPDHFRMFNARSESVREKASFRRLITKNRCLVAAEGFYEWKKDGCKKQPYYIHFRDHRPLVFAALYDVWENSEGDVLHTFTILTTSSSSDLEWLHDRMPVIFGNKTSMNRWLTSSSSELDLLLKPYQDSDLVWYPVTPAMGKISFDGPECIKELKSADSKPISMFFAKKADNIKARSFSEVGDPTKSVPSENLNETISEGTEEPSHSDDIKKESCVLAMKEEQLDEENKEMLENPQSDEIRKLDTPKNNDVKDGEEVNAIKALLQEANDNEGSFEKYFIDENRLDIEADGIKWKHEQIKDEPSKHPTIIGSRQKSAGKKRGRSTETEGDRQSTLLSFFGKK